jgi:RHS repeat-associated protein
MTYDVGAYRYGYNGMEKDDEAKNNGNSYTTEFRQYDPRLGRWLSLDPKMAEFPQWSPYVAFNDNPVMYVDPTGLKGEPIKGNFHPGKGIFSKIKGKLEKAVAFLKDKLSSFINKVGKVFKDPKKSSKVEQAPPPGKWMDPVDVIKTRTIGDKIKGAFRSIGKALKYIWYYEQGNSRFVDDPLVGNSSYKTGGGIDIRTKDGNDYSNIDFKDFHSKEAVIVEIKLMFGFAINSGISGKSSGSMLLKTKEVLDRSTDGANAAKNVGEAVEKNPNTPTTKDIMVEVWYLSNYNATRVTITEGPYDTYDIMKKKHPRHRWNNKRGIYEAGAFPKKINQ